MSGSNAELLAQAFAGEFSESKLTRGRVYADTAALRDAVDGMRPG